MRCIFINTSEKVKSMMTNFDLTLEDVSKYLGITTQSLRNKLNRDSFSIKDLIIISHLSKATLSIQFEDKTIKPIIFKLDDLPSEDYDRLKQLDYKSIQSTFERLKKTISKLPPEDQKSAIEYLKTMQNDL